MCFFRDVTLSDDVKAKMGRVATAVTESEEDLNKFKCKGAEIVLPKHSYWFDFWVFLLFDLSLLFVVYFIVP